MKSYTCGFVNFTKLRMFLDELSVALATEEYLRLIYYQALMQYIVCNINQLYLIPRSSIYACMHLTVKIIF